MEDGRGKVVFPQRPVAVVQCPAVPLLWPWVEGPTVSDWPYSGFWGKQQRNTTARAVFRVLPHFLGVGATDEDGPGRIRNPQLELELSTELYPTWFIG